MGPQLFHSRSGICIIIAYQRVQHQQRSSHLLRSCLVLHLLNRSCSKCMGFLSLLMGMHAWLASWTRIRSIHIVCYLPPSSDTTYPPAHSKSNRRDRAHSLTHSLFLFRVGPSRSHLWNSYYQHRGRDGYNLQTTNR